MGNLVLLHAVGAVGGIVAKRKKIPAGAMLGALVFVIFLNVFTGLDLTYPLPLRRAVQILSGVIIGSRFTRKDVRMLRTLAWPAIILVVTLTAINVLFAWLIGLTSDLSVITALFAAAPGGMTDMALIAADFGAHTEQVAILQILRFVVVVMATPMLVRRLQDKQAAPEGPAEEAAVSPMGLADPPSKKTFALRAVLSFAVASAGSLLAQWIGIPAGAIIGGIIATIILNVTTEKAYIPPITKPIVQIGAGCYIGTRITLTVLSSLHLFIVPMALLVLEVFVMTFGTAWIIHKLTKMDLITAIFSCVPGGMTELGIMAEEMKLDIPKVILMHTCRVIFVICMMPILLKLLTGGG